MSPIGQIIKLRARHGFTLVELLVVMAILGVLVSTLYTTFKGGTNAWKAGDARSQRGQNARATLEIMSRDLKAAFTRTGSAVLQFYGVDGSWTDTGVTPSQVRAADGIYFTAASNYPNESDDYDLEEVGYCLDTAARAINRIECDRESKFLDGDLTNGTATELAPHVIGLNLRYNDGTNWSSNGSYTQSTTLPKAVEITLTVEDEDQAESPRDYKTIVYIP